MTSMMLAIIGILIAAVGTAGGFVYYEMESGSGLEGGITVSEGVVAMTEAAESYRESTGSPATSLDDLKTADSLPTLPRFPGASWSIGRDPAGASYICMYAVRGNVADRSLSDAAKRLGEKSFVSGACGTRGEPGPVIALSYPMGVVSTPPIGS